MKLLSLPPCFDEFSGEGTMSYQMASPMGQGITGALPQASACGAGEDGYEKSHNKIQWTKNFDLICWSIILDETVKTQA